MSLALLIVIVLNVTTDEEGVVEDESVEDEVVVEEVEGVVEDDGATEVVTESDEEGIEMDASPHAARTNAANATVSPR
jgi:hypothetical protein